MSDKITDIIGHTRSFTDGRLTVRVDDGVGYITIYVGDDISRIQRNVTCFGGDYVKKITVRVDEKNRYHLIPDENIRTRKHLLFTDKKVINGNMKVLPPPKDCCQTCATKHDPKLPHNQQSLYYQMTFNMRHGRGPTWTDAMEHCTPEMKEIWIVELKKRGIKFSEAA